MATRMGRFRLFSLVISAGTLIIFVYIQFVMDTPDSLYKKGDLYMEYKQFEQAKLAYSKAIAFEASSQPSWISFNLGVIHYAEGQYDQAGIYFYKFIRSKVNGINIHLAYTKVIDFYSEQGCQHTEPFLEQMDSLKTEIGQPSYEMFINLLTHNHMIPDDFKCTV